MSDDKTEAASGKRRDKERDQGNISKSQDLNSALMVTTSIALLGMFSGKIFETLETLLQQTFTHLNPKDISTDNILLIFLPFAKASGDILLPFLLVLMVAAYFIIRSQVGHVFAIDKIKFNLENLAPSKMLQGLKKMFNPVDPNTAVEFIKSFIKLIVVGMCGFSVLNGRKDELYGLLGMDVNGSFIIIGSILSNMLINMCIAMIVIGILDKKFQDYQYEKSIKMSKQELKDEYKDSEGDPKIKAKIRSMQMKMAQQKMMSNIPTADVVVTNPTHYAVAIKYDKTKAAAPMVVAKGVDFVAFKIREVAENNKIPIIENRPLARALYKLVPVDGIIPSDMFVAVAEVLAYVYNKNKK
jgi:flagellar biosynthetic protein FlhB